MRSQYPTPDFEHKICTVETLRSHLLTATKPIVFTNGVFDILHRGHVTYLAQARTLGMELIVGVNSDHSVRTLGKGDDRPLNPQADRIAVLAALAAVDWVVMFNESTPLALLAEIRPDIYVKGGDYDINILEETKLMHSWGGKAYAIPFIHPCSTTKLLARARTKMI